MQPLATCLARQPANRSAIRQQRVRAGGWRWAMRRLGPLGAGAAVVRGYSCGGGARSAGAEGRGVVWCASRCGMCCCVEPPWPRGLEVRVEGKGSSAKCRFTASGHFCNSPAWRSKHLSVPECLHVRLVFCGCFCLWFGLLCLILQISTSNKS